MRAWLLILLGVLSLTAGDAPLRIALVLPGVASDGGWNQLANQCLTTIATKRGFEVTVLEKITPDLASKQLHTLMDGGYDLVIAHGNEYLDPATEAAAKPSKTKVAVFGATREAANIAVYDFDLSQASYQMGVVAARMSRTGKLGFISGAPIPPVQACVRGFKAGAMAVRPGITVIESFTGWNQLEDAKRHAERMLSQGVDVIYQNVDKGCLGVFATVAERTAIGFPAWVIGSVANQNDNPVCGGQMLGSVVVNLDLVIDELVTAVQSGRFKAGLRYEGLADGMCGAVLNARLIGSTIPMAVVQDFELAGKRLLSGKVTVPK